MNLTTLAEHAGVTTRQVEHWVARGLTTAPVVRTHRAGRPARHWTAEEADVVVTMAELSRQGRDLDAVADAARQLVTEGHANLGPFTITRSNP